MQTLTLREARLTLRWATEKQALVGVVANML